MREYYDLWPRFTPGSGAPGARRSACDGALIHAADRYLLTRNVRKLFVQSRTIQQRLAIWPELRVARCCIRRAPQRPYRCEGYGDYVFMVSRLTPLKRADLLLEALAQPEAAGIRAVIAGEGEERGALEALDRATRARRSRDARRAACPTTQLLDHLARCRAVCFPPLDEDYGFVTVEAFASRKAVITCRDSGGPAELVEDGVTGFVCEPDARRARRGAPST